MSAALVRASELPSPAALPRRQAWLTPAVSPVTPHPNVELIKPAAFASSIPAVSHHSLAVSKAVGQARQGWSPVPSHEASREWHPAQDIPSQANVQAGEVRANGSIVEHGHSIALRERIWSQ